MSSHINNDAAGNGQAVTVNLADLEAGSVPFEKLEEAFGPESLGIIVVRDLPARFLQLRTSLLQYSSYLAALPAAELDALTSSAAKYLVGWSHGKESLKAGVPDTMKGSYYVNCAFHADSSLEAAPADQYPNFPEYTAPNIWPSETSMPGFRTTFVDLCNLIIDVAALVARACDRYAIKHVPAYIEGYMERMVRDSLTTKARLLHYFPPEPASNPSPKDQNDTPEDDDSWCATHLDHGCLTGLTSALFIDETDGLPNPSSTSSTSASNSSTSAATSSSSPSSSPPSLKQLPASPDPKAGLYIRSRQNVTTKVTFPPDTLAFQTGEALERITQGKFRAVPHFVRGPFVGGGGDGGAGGGGDSGKGERRKVARNTLAVFTQPNLNEVIDTRTQMTFADFARDVVGRNTVS